MTERLFDLTFYLAVPFWALMILAPSWSWTRRIIGSPYIVVPPLTVWFVQLLPSSGRSPRRCCRPTWQAYAA